MRFIVQTDNNSPLQPLTPLSVNADFSFQIGGDGSLTPHRGKLEVKPKLQLQQPHQGQPCCPPEVYRNPNPIRTKRQVCACVAGTHIGSPLPQSKALFLNIHPPSLGHREEYSAILKTISRMHFALEQVGMLKYWDYLKRYGIDFNKFKKLTCKDLEYLGIRNPEHLAKLLKAVEMAGNMY